MITLPGYEIQTQLYESPRSQVFRGRRSSDGAPVVLKLLRSEYPSPQELARFRHEFEVTRDLELDGAIRAYALVEYHHTLVMVLEDVGGASLLDVCNALPSGILAIADFLPLAIHLSQALEEIHQRHIMHKDINPANIVWNPRTSQVKIIDFGISTTLSREKPAVRSPSVLEGTLLYMSPEQTGRVNRALDYRTDYYSLGVTFYELLTGRPPFIGADAMELVHAHIAKQPLPPHVVQPAIPSPLSDIILKLLAKNAEDRYQSAYGLQMDLEECLRQWQATEAIEPFPLGQRDRSDRFQIPQTLYGREFQVAELLDTFARVSTGGVELILVSGHSGIGKTALVNEVHKPLVAQQGLFITGKSDQLKQNVPYASLIQAFGDLARQIIAEGEATVAAWRDRLVAALGPNGQVVIDLIPEVQLIIGPQPPVPALPPTESQNRFNLVFQQFVHVFAQSEHPLVIFLDDLQWADSATLGLLQALLTAPGDQALLLIGAYRDNEVNAAHPLPILVEGLQIAGVPVHRISLAPLEMADIAGLLADTLHSTPDRVAPLAELVHRKTGGNPFFVTELLNTLYRDGLLEYDSGEGQWRWDVRQIQARGITDNVVELMASKIQQLPPTTQAVLKLAACVGTQFDLATLAIVYQKSQAQTATDLSPALQEGLVFPAGDSYKFLSVNGDDLAAPDEEVVYWFLHDRVQQAAYSLIPDDQKQQIHLRVGRLLLQGTKTMDLPDRVFVIVNHLNLGAELITDLAERERLAQLNLMAGQKARAATAYAPALTYLSAGMSLLAANSWQDQYELTTALYQARGECEYLQGNFAAAEALLDAILHHARTSLEKAAIYNLKTVLYNHRFKAQEALEAGLAGLSQLGVDLPRTDEELQVAMLAEVHLIQVNLGQRTIADLVDLPELTGPVQQLTMALYDNLSVSAYFVNKNLNALLIAKMVSTSIVSGNTGVSVSGYATWGFIQGLVFGDLKAGYEYGQLALAVNAKLHDTALAGRAAFQVAATVNHFQRHGKSTLELLQRAYQLCLEAGDLLYASFATSLLATTAYMIGRPVDELREIIDRYGDTLSLTKNQWADRSWPVFRQTLKYLQGQTPSRASLNDSQFDEARHLEFLARLAADGTDAVSLNSVCMLLAMLYYLFEEYDTALQYAQRANETMAASFGQFYPLMHKFHYCLILAAHYPKATEAEQREYWKVLEDTQQWLENWVANSPENFEHQAELIAAEMARLAGRDLDAMDRYDKAIAMAHDHDQPIGEALAYELAGRFHQDRGRGTIARAYLTEARYGYLHAGLTGKVQQLEARYPQWLREVSEPTQRTWVASVESMTSTGSASQLDLSTVLKASQAISSEIDLNRLLATLVQIAIENAGAQKGCLILDKGGRLLIEAAVNVDDGSSRILQSIPVESPEGSGPDGLLPGSIVNYVAQLREPVVLADAVREGPFTRSRYVAAHQPRSVLCMPLLHQGRLSGILYLENNLVTGAFTPDRLELLRLLSAQAAISIGNARLYADLTDLNRAYERFVPREFLNYLSRTSIVDVQLGDGIQGEMSVIFTDIRSFTDLAEGMSPRGIFDFLNDYLRTVGPAIRTHHGFIDKYLGDGFMALFPTHPEDAVQATLSMRQLVASLNERRSAAGLPDIQIGVGIHTGSLLLGIVGEQERMDGTVVADAVNLASRLEGLTKFYGVTVIISDASLSRLPDPSRYHYRRLGKARVKGKRDAVQVYEIFDGDPQAMIAAKVETQPEFEAGLKLYSDREFTLASVHFSNVLKRSPEDKAARLYLQRCAQFMVQGVPSDWDGTEALDAK